MTGQNFGARDFRVATSLPHVALIYSAHRDFAAAEPPAQRALKRSDPARCGSRLSERRCTVSKLADTSAVSAVRFVDLGSSAAIR